MTWEPNLTLVKTKKVGKVLVDSYGAPGVIVDVLSLSCQSIKDKASDVKGVIKALYRAVDYMKANPEKADAIMAKGVGGYLENPEGLCRRREGGEVLRPGDDQGISRHAREARSNRRCDQARQRNLERSRQDERWRIDYPMIVDSSAL